MNRNTILYILIALLVVVGGVWYALSARSTEETQNDSNGSQEVLNGGEESDEEDADGENSSNGDVDTGASTSVNGGSSNNSGSVAPSDNVSGGSNTGIGGGSTEYVPAETQHLSANEAVRLELSLQLQVLESILKVIELQLESGDISVDDAADLLDIISEAVESLEDSVEAYLAL